MSVSFDAPTLLLKDFAYVDEQFKAGQGTKENPYLITKARLLDPNKAEITTEYFGTGDDQYSVRLYKEDDTVNFVEEVPISTSEAGTVAYVERYHNITEGDPKPSDWYKITLFREGTLYDVNIVNGSGSGEYKVGETINISANPAPTGKVFDKWTSPDGISFVDANAEATSFVMPEQHVRVTATYKDAPIPTYSITVENDGNGSGNASLVNAKAGEEITLIANANTGYTFKAWEVVSGSITITDSKFIMPANEVVVKATFTKLPEVPTYSYKILLGDKSIWEKGSVQGITIKIDGDFNKFKAVEVDGKVLNVANYEVSAGSTVILLKPTYLQTLKVGDYKMTTKFDGVEVASTFSIKEKAEEDKQPEKPDTGEKEDKPDAKPGDKLPGMGDNTKPLALLLIALGGLLFTKSKTKE